MGIIAVLFMISTVSAATLYESIYSDVASYHGSNEESRWITDAILYASDLYGVDPILLTAVMESESRFNFSAVSPAGAVGLMQIMPETGRGLGVDIYDPFSNILGGAYYLRTLLDSFSGYGTMAVTDAVAAYNAGAQKVIDYGGCPPYRETIQYVNNVYSSYIQILNSCQ